MATTQFHSEDVTDLPGFQTFLADRRLARENQIPHFTRWVRRFLWHCGGDMRSVSPDSILTFRRTALTRTARASSVRPSRRRIASESVSSPARTSSKNSRDGSLTRFARPT